MNETVTNGSGTKAAAEVVAMSDGREVEFAGKRKMLKESIIDGDTIKIRLDFRNGETRLITLPADLIPKFAAHGAEQKYGDETAGETDVDDMVLAIDDLDARLQRGEWSTIRQGSGMSGTSVLLKALVELSGRSIEQVKAFLADKSQADKMALRNSAKLKPIVERLEAAKLEKAGKVDVEGMLATL